MPPGSDAPGAERGMHARTAVAAAAGLVDAADLAEQLAVGGGPAALRPPTPGVVAGRGDLQHLAQDPDGKGLAVFVNEVEPHFACPEKMPMAFFKMSRSICTRSSSRRRRRISVWSAVIAGIAAA